MPPRRRYGLGLLRPDGAARAGGMNPQMFNSFLDGTKSGIEMAAVANATGLTPPPDGLRFPPCGTHELAEVLRPGNAGVLHHAGQVEVISSLHRDGSNGDQRPALGRVTSRSRRRTITPRAASRNTAWSPIPRAGFPRCTGRSI
jgi:hypothetical protein